MHLNKIINIYGTSKFNKSSLGAQTDLDRKLKALVTEYGSSVYDNAEELRIKMLNFGISRIDTHKVCLFALTKGFSVFTSSDGELLQSDIDRVYNNALEQTGLCRLEVLTVMHAILLSLDKATEFDAVDYRAFGEVQNAYVIPSTLYQEQITSIHRSIILAESEGRTVGSDVVEQLEPLVLMGIPKAKYLMGHCMLNCMFSGTEYDGGGKEGLQLLKEAACDGNAQAMAELGDFYYNLGVNSSFHDTWGKAFDCYTGFGSLALTDTRKHCITNIVNHGVFNVNMMRYSTLLVLALVASIVLGFRLQAYDSQTTWGMIIILLTISLFAWAWARNRKYPYGNTYYVPVVLFAAWCLYFTIRFICY